MHVAKERIKALAERLCGLSLQCRAVHRSYKENGTVAPLPNLTRGNDRFGLPGIVTEADRDLIVACL